MKKILLFSLLLTAGKSVSAQAFYPSGSQSTPTWMYFDVSYVGGYGTYSNPTTGNFGNVIDEAELDYASYYWSDAYDGAFEFFVNSPDSVYTEIGTADTTGTTITLQEQLINGLYVSKQYFFSPIVPVVRVNYIIRNPTASAITSKFGMYTNLGSDGATVLDSSSTDGVVLSDLDRWMITTDSLFTSDPTLTWVRFGPGTIESTPWFGIKPELHNGYFEDTILVTIPANSFKTILQFNRMDSTIAAARANASSFNTAASLQALGFLDGMDSYDLASVVNWDFSALYAAIPETYNAVNDVKVSPNPSKGLFKVALNTESQIVVTNLFGQIVYANATANGIHVIDLTDQANGVYLVTVITENSEHIQKLIKE